jgi:hypothetical protein
MWRVIGLVLAGVAIWLAADWFADEIPSEVRPWTANTLIARAVFLLALASLAVAFWARKMEGPPHARWANRALSPAALAFAVVLAFRWFGSLFGKGFEPSEVERVTLLLAIIATGTCLAIAGGAYLLRERPANLTPTRRSVLASEPIVPARPLPVALLLDERDRPVVPKTSRDHADPIGG